MLGTSSMQLTPSTAPAGDIVFTNDAPIDSQAGENNDLTLNAGTASIFFNANIGQTQRLGDFLIDTAAGGVTFGGADANTGAGGSGPLPTMHTRPTTPGWPVTTSKATYASCRGASIFTLPCTVASTYEASASACRSWRRDSS
mgnify:CR=1 FL=1